MQRDRRGDPGWRRPWRAVAGTGVVAVAAWGPAALAPRSGAAAPRAAATVVQVVAAENFWGSIASQLGGRHVHVVSIVTNPNTDPHSCEPTSKDARTIAGADLVLENGIGYDGWAARIVSADQTHPMVLNVGDVVGAHDGDNPHRWYNPADVQAVIDRLVADYQRLDPVDAASFAEQRVAFTRVALAQYHSLLGAIKGTSAGTPVGASESIVSMLAPSLGLHLITPPSSLRAISEGTELTAADKATIDRQIERHQIRIYVYNRQNVTPDVKEQLALVRRARIPYATITETLQPADATFQAWQVRQLRAIQGALAKAASG